HQAEIMGAFLPWYTFAAVILLVVHGGLCVDIIGGNEVKPHSRPFMAQIKGPDRNIIFVLGAHSFKKREKEQQAFGIAKYITHPCYDPSTKENDIMLLQLRGRAKLNRAVKPIPLPTSDDDLKPGTVCTVAGWGTTTN
ncbi:GRAA protein, partial [Chaetops frenatus]|nr:GRAA protein [Chaetops frenatus]